MKLNFLFTVAAMVTVLVGMALIAVAAERQKAGWAWVGLFLMAATAITVAFLTGGNT